MSEPFKYTTAFSSNISCIDPGKDFEKVIANDSLESLRELAPKDIDLEKNLDLLGVAFNAAVANRFNKNDDGVDAQTAIAIKDYFIHKPTNIEHQKSKVVGHIVSASLSEFETSRLIKEEDVRESTDPFNISLAAVLYKTVNPAFVELVERSVDEEDEYYQKVSASWEIGFNDYKIALGSRDLRDAEIISEEKHVAELQKYLKAYGGDGKTEDGVEVYRLISGEIYPLGIGFTSAPAAAVKGVELLQENKNPFKIKDKRKAIVSMTNTVSHSESEKNAQKVSHFGKRAVIIGDQYFKVMETKDIVQKLEEVLSDHSDNTDFSEKAVANVAKFFHDTILEKNEIWKKEKDEKETAIKKLQEEGLAQEEDVAQLKVQLAETSVELQQLQAENNARNAADKFNERMSELDSAYELDDEDRILLASELKDLEMDEESFSSYRSKLAITWKHKTKAFKEEQEKTFTSKVEEEVAKRLEELSSEKAPQDPEEVIEAAIENITEEGNQSVPNNNGEAAEDDLTLRERFLKAFSQDNVKIEY